MSDPRIQKLAEILIRYSLDIQPGDKLMIDAWTPASPLVTAAYREALRAGAHVLTRLNLPDVREIQLKESNDSQLTFISDIEKAELEYVDAILFLRAEDNTRSLSSVDPKRISRQRAARRGLSARLDERAMSGELRWCLTKFPTNAQAQEAGMSLSEYEDFVYDACLLNAADPVATWRAVGAQQQHIVDYLMQHDTIHITAPDTDITYRTGGRTWINADGKVNFPDGEVFSAPIEDSVNGTVRFSYPAIYNGNEVEDVRLTFRDGLVVEATAARGQDFLRAMLDTDEGAKRLGEVAFGTNYGIQRFTKDMLYDEKIGGTMHMAVGAAYKGCGGLNESGIHWDMLCNLAQGKVYADGELCYENGKFLI